MPLTDIVLDAHWSGVRDLREGQLAGTSFLSFDTIIQETFLRTRARLEIDGSTEISGNKSFGIVGTPPNRIKGGGIYLFRFFRESDSFVAMGMRVVIEDVTAVSGNLLEAQPAVSFPDAVEFFLDDQVERRNQPIDGSNMASFLTSSGFIYNSPAP